VDKLMLVKLGADVVKEEVASAVFNHSDSGSEVLKDVVEHVAANYLGQFGKAEVKATPRREPMHDGSDGIVVSLVATIQMEVKVWPVQQEKPCPPPA